MKQFKKGGILTRFERGPPNIGDKICSGDRSSGFIRIIGIDNTPFYLKFKLHALKHLDGCQEWANVESDAMDKEYNEMNNCSDLNLLRNVVEELLNKMELFKDVEQEAVEYNYSNSHGWMLRRHGVCLFYNVSHKSKSRHKRWFQRLPGYAGLGNSYVIHMVSIFCCDDDFEYNVEKTLRAVALPIQTRKTKARNTVQAELQDDETVQAELQDDESREIKRLKSLLQLLKREVRDIEDKIELEQQAIQRKDKGDELVKQLKKNRPC